MYNFTIKSKLQKPKNNILIYILHLVTSLTLALRFVMARLKTVKSIFVNIFLFLDNGLFQPTAVQHLSVLLVPLFYGAAVRCAIKKWSFIMFNEVHSSHGHTLLLITKPSLQATALLQHLKQSLAITGKLHNIQRSLEDISAGCIVLMDMMEADKKLIHYWQDNLSRKTII